MGREPGWMIDGNGEASPYSPRALDQFWMTLGHYIFPDPGGMLFRFVKVWILIRTVFGSESFGNEEVGVGAYPPILFGKHGLVHHSNLLIPRPPSFLGWVIVS